jgi:hypothetical protein
MSTPSTDRIDQLALVWIMVPRKESRASGFSEQLKAFVPGKDERNRLANESIARLRERGLIEPGRLLQLTEAGRRRTAELLGGASITTGRTALVRAKKILLLRSLDVAPTPAALNTAGTSTALAARIVARQYELDRKKSLFVSDPKKKGPPPVASRVVAALARRALGMQETFSPLRFGEAFSALFLADPSPTPLEKGATNGHSEPATPAVSLRLEECTLAEFAQRVREATQSTATGRWHGAVFISHVWNALRARGNVGITFERFKRRLVDAHQKDLIELSRADLVDAMSPADVSDSETAHSSGARFHFVRLEQRAN